MRPDAPLVVAANRDEWLSRPAASAPALREADPRILGGRDEVAGGTWLAVNEHGVVAGLTNKPGKRDPTRRSRGELPLFLARHRTAEAAARAFMDEIDGAAYSPCWLLVGDRDSLHYLDAPEMHHQVLPAGVHALENRPLGAPSGKVHLVTREVADAATWPRDRLVEGSRRSSPATPFSRPRHRQGPTRWRVLRRPRRRVSTRAPTAPAPPR